MFDRIFSKKNNGNYRVFTICGLKLKLFSYKKSLKRIENFLLSSEKNPQLPREMQFNPVENIMSPGFYRDFITHDFTKKYLKLISGLDNESINLVNKILYRIQQYAYFGKTKFIVDDNEFNLITNVMNTVSSCVRLSDEYISVNGYCLSNDFIFNSASVFYKHFIESIKDKEKILNGDIIDAGAYIGDSAIVLSGYTNGVVHAFEPQTSNFESLKKNIKINELNHKIVPVKLGLSDELCNHILHYDDSLKVCSSLNKNITTNSQEDIELTTIDKYVESNDIKVGLIKTDVEGFEKNLLRGAINTIKRDKPVLMISIYHSFDDFFDIKPMIESFNLGYKFTIKKPMTLDIACDIVLNAEIPNS